MLEVQMRLETDEMILLSDGEINTDENKIMSVEIDKDIEINKDSTIIIYQNDKIQAIISIRDNTFKTNVIVAKHRDSDLEFY